MPSLETLRIKIFADGADLESIRELRQNVLIRGFTTNPTLMRRAKVEDYRRFALQAIEVVRGLPISFEVFSDEFDIMEKQALQISSWGENVYVKIPITNTRGEDAGPLIRRLSQAGVKINVTAMTTRGQVEHIMECLAEETPCYLSLFAGRVADTGCDPLPIMMGCLQRVRTHPNAELIWASPRELLNIFQADSIGCHIITVTSDILAKLPMVGRDLGQYSLETVRMFYRDALQAGFSIEV